MSLRLVTSLPSGREAMEVMKNTPHPVHSSVVSFWSSYLKNIFVMWKKEGCFITLCERMCAQWKMYLYWRTERQNSHESKNWLQHKINNQKKHQQYQTRTVSASPVFSSFKIIFTLSYTLQKYDLFYEV